MTPADLLCSLEACDEAVAWAETQPDIPTAWANCVRPDWMLWYLGKTDIPADDPRYRLIGCDFAEAVLHLAPAGDDRPRLAIETARRYARGEATAEELAAARSAAWSAAESAAESAAAESAAWSAAESAAESAAWSAAWSAESAAEAAAWSAAESAQADIIRAYFPTIPPRS